MQCTTERERRYWKWGVAAHVVAILSVVALTVAGTQQESLGGWVACPPFVMVLEERRRKRQRRTKRYECAWRLAWSWLRRSWMIAAIRSEVLLGLVFLLETREWEWVWVLPWVSWLWKGLGIAWPEVGRWPAYEAVGRVWEKASGAALVGLGLAWVSQQFPEVERWSIGALPLGCCLQSGASDCCVEVEQDEEGQYHVRLSGTFELHVDGNVEFRKRMLVIFLGLLDVPGETRGSRRTRDGRTPFVREEQMGKWFGVPHPVISRWYDYWLREDWRRLLSQRKGEVLTLEVQQQVVDTWVKTPWQGAEAVWRHLRSQGNSMTLNQVKQIGRESGWFALQKALRQVYLIGPESFRVRDEWVTEQLLATTQRLVERLDAMEGLTPEERLEIADLEAVCGETGLRPAVHCRPLPWILRVERLLFGHWEWVDDGDRSSATGVRCIYCGTTHVSRKSRKPRLKHYVDEQGNEQSVEVYRYYCHNPACKYKTFTNLPPNLIPYSKWTLNHHLAALQSYEWSHSVYRCTSQLLGVCKMTSYRWVSAFGYQLLPVAALFGVVRSSGVVGIDEKYVLVPKNDKPESDMKRWMYVYFAVDSYTYDLLHIEIYPYKTKQSAYAFLLALRAKGYHPRVIVTDLRADYRDVIAHAFPDAIHHECIFHALQDVHVLLKEAYGSGYAEKHPHVAALKHDINHIFDARTKRTAEKRYRAVLAQREDFVDQTPDAAAVFDFLERHWPTMVNAIESQLIPTTNNATEEVIRIFNQHYKTFCGFESIDTARLYLAVFEKVYRFTPFSADAQERIRGKCPLELAGYEVRKLPMAQLFRGLALQWPAAAFQEVSLT